MRGARGSVRRRRRARAATRPRARRWRPRRRTTPTSWRRTSRRSTQSTAPCRPAAPLLNRASAGPLHPRLDLQGRDGDGRPRLRPLHAREHLRRPRLLHPLRQARHQLRRPERPAGLRPHHARRGARELVNSVFCNIGKRLGADAVLEQARALRLLRGAAHRAPRRRRARERPLPERQALPARRPERGRSRAGSPSARNACWSPRCRWRSSRPASPTTASSWSRSSSSESSRPDGDEIDSLDPEEWKTAMSAAHGSRAPGHDEGRGRVGHRHLRADPRRHRRRQDGHRRNRAARARTTPGSSPSRRSSARRWQSPSRSRTRTAPAARPPHRSRRRSWKRYCEESLT